MARRRSSGRFTAGVTGAALGVAAGAALGAYVLNPAGSGIQIGGGDAAAERDAAKAQLAEQTTRADEANQIIEPATKQIVDGALADVPVVLVVTPDADEKNVKGVAETLRAAGAPDGGTLKLTEKFVTAASADELKDVVANSLPANTQLDAQRRDPGRQAGQALAPVLQLDKEGGEQASAADRGLLLGSLRDAGFVDYADGTMRPSAAVVIVSGAGASGSADAAFGARLLADVAEALGENGSVVVAGTPDARGGDGILGAIGRKGAGVSDKIGQVGVVGDVAGRVGVVQKVAEKTK